MVPNYSPMFSPVLLICQIGLHLLQEALHVPRHLTDGLQERRTAVLDLLRWCSPLEVCCKQLESHQRLCRSTVDPRPPRTGPAQALPPFPGTAVGQLTQRAKEESMRQNASTNKYVKGGIGKVCIYSNVLICANKPFLINVVGLRSCIWGLV